MIKSGIRNIKRLPCHGLHQDLKPVLLLLSILNKLKFTGSYHGNIFSGPCAGFLRLPPPLSA